LIAVGALLELIALGTLLRSVEQFRLELIAARTHVANGCADDSQRKSAFTVGSVSAGAGAGTGVGCDSIDAVWSAEERFGSDSLLRVAAGIPGSRA
jgi:hypothetical protein